MDANYLNELSQNLITWGAEFGLKALGAIAIWVIGRKLINLGVSLITRALKKQPIDVTIVTFVGSAVTILLNITLIVALLGFFGVETTSFAALLAAAGFAIGAAWSGLLANFAAGAFLIVLRPFKVGDFIQAGGVIGTVAEVGLFVTTIDTPDNVRTFVGNNKVFGDNISNFSANPYRRVDLTAQLHGGVDHRDAIARLQQRVAQIPNVLKDPAPTLEILEFTPFGPVLAVRPFCNNKDYWQVYFDTNRAIRETFGDAGYPGVEHRLVVRNES